MKKRFFGHNFSVVYKFEVVRTLKKKTFWLALLAFPILIAAIFGISYWSGKSMDDTADQFAKAKFSYAIMDESGAISPDIAKNLTTISDKNTGIAQVQSGQLDAYFYFPSDLAKNKVQIFAKNVGIFDNSKYQAVAQGLLQSSAAAETSPEIAAILAGQVSYDATTYQDGKVYNPLMEMIAPGIFLVLFYLIIITFGSQMMNSTVEEKENRVSEMILTTIRARTLIIGKIFAQLTLVLVQIVVLLALVVAAYLLLRDNLNIGFDFSGIVFDLLRIIVSALIFVFSLLLFTGLLVAVGAAVPTAKEAGQFSAVPILLIVAPLYAITIFISQPAASASVFLTLFPFTAPLPMMIRNAIGNLTAWETIVGLVLLAIASVIVFIVAARLFQTGAVEYGKKLSLKSIFAKK